MPTNKTKTIKLHGNEYAQVAERIRAFREVCPDGKIITKRIPFSEKDGNVENEITYRTYIWKNRKTYISPDLLSCDSSAEASLVMEKSEKKQKEKLETISVGRALAMLGFLASGEVASAEEMEDFYRERDEKAKVARLEYKEKVIDELKATNNLDDLRAVYVNSNLTNDIDVVKVKDEMKETLSIKPKTKKLKTAPLLKEKVDKNK